MFNEKKVEVCKCWLFFFMPVIFLYILSLHVTFIFVIFIQMMCLIMESVVTKELRLVDPGSRVTECRNSLGGLCILLQLEGKLSSSHCLL